MIINPVMLPEMSLNKRILMLNKKLYNAISSTTIIIVVAIILLSVQHGSGAQ